MIVIEKAGKNYFCLFSGSPGMHSNRMHERMLLVNNTPVPYPENENTIRKDCIDNSPVSHTVFIQSPELTGQCFTGFRIFCKPGLYLMDYPFCNRSVNLF